MKATLATTPLLPVVLGLICISCIDTIAVKTAPRDAPLVERTVEAKSSAVRVSTNAYLYYVRAGGAYTGITNAPRSNPVYISFVRWETLPNLGPVGVFRLTNAESHTIWWWNIRSEVRAASSAKDRLGLETARKRNVQPNAVSPAETHLGWETATDDYPMGPGKSRIASGESSEFWAKRPDKAPWRVCVLYSIDWEGTGKQAWGNYEVISEEMNEYCTGPYRRHCYENQTYLNYLVRFDHGACMCRPGAWHYQDIADDFAAW